jgi:hypothetical protein
MSSLTERDAAIKRCYVDAAFRLPDPDPRGPHFPVQVIGVIEQSDELVAACGDRKHIVDFVCWWPALRKWTVTHTCRGTEDAIDFPCTVTHWQPDLPLPW